VALIVDVEEVCAVEVAPDSKDTSQCWNSQPPGSSIPSSIHSNSSRSSDGAVSVEPSVLESISGHTKDRHLASVKDSDEVGRKTQSAEFWKLPDDNPAGSYLGFEDIHLNETLKSLMETKTPMLPSRLRAAVKPSLHSTLPSVTSVEPRKSSTHRVGLGDIQTSTCDDLLFASPGYDLPRLPRRSPNTDFKAPMVTELANGSYRKLPQKSPVQSHHNRSINDPVHNSHVEAVIQNGHNAACKNCSWNAAQSEPTEPLGAVKRSAVDSSMPAAEPELLACSVPARNVLTSSLAIAPHTDSLIARYDRVAAANVEDDLCNDSFDDIRLSLQNISVDSAHAPLHDSSQPIGLFHDF